MSAEEQELKVIVEDFIRSQRAIVYAEILFAQDRFVEAAEILGKVRPIIVSVEDRLMAQKKGVKIVKKVDPKTPKDNRGVKPNPKAGNTK
jgi:hypothetical protein